MPRIDPLRLLNCLSILLAPNGGIRSTEEVKRLANLMDKYSKKLVSKCIYVQICKSTETELLDQFMTAGGWSLAHNWLSDGILSQNWPLVRELLELLLLCPVDVARLKSNSAPKLVKQLSKDGSPDDVRILATKLVEQWLKIVKSETTGPKTMPTPTVIKSEIKIENEEQMEVTLEEEEMVDAPTTPNNVIKNKLSFLSKNNGMVISSNKTNSRYLPASEQEMDCLTNGEATLETDPLDITEIKTEILSPTSLNNKTKPVPDSPSNLVFKITTAKDGKSTVERVDPKPKEIDMFSELNKQEAKIEVKKSISSSSSKENKDKSDSRDKGKDLEKRKDKSKDDKDKDKHRDKKSSSSSHKSSSTSRSHSSSSKSDHNTSKSSSSSHKSSSDRKSSSSSSSRDKDRHKSSSSSSKSSSSRDKDKEKEKLKKEEKDKEVKTQVDKDKDTLSKLIPPSINKLGKIPKKKDDSTKTDEEAKPDDSTTASTAPKPKPSISIEVRKDAENRPKTVKAFNSQFRSHGLAEEAPPPPPRKGLKKPSTTVPTGTTIPTPAPVKRPSPPPKDIVEKRIKLEASPTQEKPGAIKLIAAKPKRGDDVERKICELMLIGRNDEHWSPIVQSPDQIFIFPYPNGELFILNKLLYD